MVLLVVMVVVVVVVDVVVTNSWHLHYLYIISIIWME